MGKKKANRPKESSSEEEYMPLDWEPKGRKSEEDSSLSSGGLESQEEYDEIQESRKRLESAKSLLRDLSRDIPREGDTDASLIDKELLASRILKSTSLSQGSQVYEPLGDLVDFESSNTGKGCSHFRGSPTCVAFSNDCRFIFSGWNTGAIRKFDIKYQRVVNHFTHTKGKKVKPVTCIAVRGEWLVAGRVDGSIDLYNAMTHRRGQVPTGNFSHRGAITALGFGPENTRIYSASADRTIKVWQITSEEQEDNVGQRKKDQIILAYIDTLHGHQDTIPSLISVSEDRCLSVGGRDRTIRLWKIVEETQLIFRGSSESDGDSMVSLAAISSEVFFSSGHGASGVSIWNIGRKKPVSRTQDQVQAVSLASLPGSDILAAGTEDGLVRIYKYKGTELHLVKDLQVSGIVNDLKWCYDEEANRLTLAAASGREGRYDRTVFKATSPRVFTFSWDVNQPGNNCMKE
jgi:ribosomal RNA-processing protein 9